MSTRPHLARLLTLVLCFSLTQTGLGAEDAPLLPQALGVLGRLRRDWETRDAAAQAAARRFLDGGQLWVAGSIPRFDIEWLNRAGGLMPVAVLKDPGKVGAVDVLVYGRLRDAPPDELERLRQIHDRGTLVVLFGAVEDAPQLRECVDFRFGCDLPRAVPMSAEAGASLALASLWAFTGDIVAACTRAGKMPTMWQSVMVPGARERNASLRGKRFDPDQKVPAVAPGVLGNRYLDEILRSVRGLIEDRGSIRMAGTLLRGTVGNSGTIFHANMGHFEPARLVPADFPVALRVLPRKEPEIALAQLGKPGYALLAVWYTDMPTALLAAGRRAGVRSVCMVARNPERTHDTSLADVFINPHWVFGDAAVAVPGYDVKILAPSGVLNSLIFYAVLAEAMP